MRVIRHDRRRGLPIVSDARQIHCPVDSEIEVIQAIQVVQVVRKVRLTQRYLAGSVDFAAPLIGSESMAPEIKRQHRCQ